MYRVGVYATLPVVLVVEPPPSSRAERRDRKKHEWDCVTIEGEKKVLWLHIGDGGMEMKIERERESGAFRKTWFSQSTDRFERAARKSFSEVSGRTRWLVMQQEFSGWSFNEQRVLIGMSLHEFVGFFFWEFKT